MQHIMMDMERMDATYSTFLNGPSSMGTNWASMPDTWGDVPVPEHALQGLDLAYLRMKKWCKRKWRKAKRHAKRFAHDDRVPAKHRRTSPS